ncbi:winged helix-turn-helix transcriptional regulator [Allonocardiopsis opalescens]|uniref:HxlR family transcriptional regulator n=1 Tax=Allonocardiopsis opalescens TaxID=1144618 RepID=A0A2T0Q9T4_9ACTN|nr:helix-turn-helix domain-containing protein [Allonocardiopsis opalescens]PRY00572.1 HxlR family transcriptional regulator [Allonocardiopsis opalescens]
MDWGDVDSRACSVARALEVVGERWSLLIVRDVFNGIRRFDELRDHLGVARNVLSQRLRTLVGARVLDRVPYREGRQRRRFEYRLTERGRELVPVLLALMAWGDRNLAGGEGPPVLAEHLDCGKRVRMVPVCGAGHVLGSASDLVFTPGPGARKSERPAVRPDEPERRSSPSRTVLPWS